jgi:hypothetical protein
VLRTVEMKRNRSMKHVLILTALAVGTVNAQIPTDRAWKIFKNGAAEKSADKREKAYLLLA